MSMKPGYRKSWQRYLGYLRHRNPGPVCTGVFNAE